MYWGQRSVSASVCVCVCVCFVAKLYKVINNLTYDVWKLVLLIRHLENLKCSFNCLDPTCLSLFWHLVKIRGVCVCVCVRPHFRCECTPGYVGEHCELDYNDCEDNKCQNGGQCIDAINGYTCVCPEGYR